MHRILFYFFKKLQENLRISEKCCTFVRYFELVCKIVNLKCDI